MLLLRGWLAGPDLEFVSTIPHFSLHFGLSAIFTNCNPLDTYLVFLNHVPLLWGSIKFLPKLLEQLSEPHSVAIWEGTWAVNRVEVIKKKSPETTESPLTQYSSRVTSLPFWLLLHIRQAVSSGVSVGWGRRWSSLWHPYASPCCHLLLIYNVESSEQGELNEIMSGKFPHP